MPQVKRNLISSITNLVYELLHELPNNLRLRRNSWVPSLPARTQISARVIRKLAKVDIKLFLSCPILLDFSILFQIFCPGLYHYSNQQSKIIFEPFSWKKPVDDDAVCIKDENKFALIANHRKLEGKQKASQGRAKTAKHLFCKTLSHIFSFVTVISKLL